jgi:hypothetical protein
MQPQQQQQPRPGRSKRSVLHCTAASSLVCLCCGLALIAVALLVPAAVQRKLHQGVRDTCTLAAHQQHSPTPPAQAASDPHSIELHALSMQCCAETPHCAFWLHTHTHTCLSACRSWTQLFGGRTRRPTQTVRSHAHAQTNPLGTRCSCVLRHTLQLAHPLRTPSHWLLLLLPHSIKHTNKSTRSSLPHQRGPRRPARPAQGMGVQHQQPG